MKGGVVKQRDGKYEKISYKLDKFYYRISTYIADIWTQYLEITFLILFEVSI